MRPVVLFLAFLSVAQAAQSQPVPAEMAQAQIVFLGEIHDNPTHHQTQAKYVRALNPTAVVFEMLTSRVAQELTVSDLVSPGSLDQATGWSGSGWPALEMYFPIFQASPRKIYGAALPRAAARAAMERGIADSFGPDAGTFGLTAPLPSEQQAKREAMQMAAHCDALPEHLLPGMVNLQRLRDAMLARTAILALDQTGGPVVVITGNGHARADWGAPSYVAQARPEVRQFSVSQTEGEARPDPAFDLVLSGPPVNRPDPCAAFR